MHNITLIEGDGIGPEIADAVIKIIDAAGVKINWDRQTAGLDVIEKEGVPLPNRVIESIKKNDVIVHQIQIVTNGTKYNDDIEQTLAELYNLATNKEKSALLISSDIYHEAEIERLGLHDMTNINTNKFIDFSNKNGIFFKHLKPKYIVSMGRAQNLQESKEQPIISWSRVAKNFNALENCARELHIAVDGSVMPQGQISYDLLEQYTIFNINEQQDIIKTLVEYTDSALCQLSFEEKFYVSLSPRYTRDNIRMIYKLN